MNTPDFRALLKSSLLKIEALEARLAKHEAARAEPIAIVGMACRLPGGAEDPGAFFRALRGGVDAVRRIPKERWPEGAIPGDNPAVRWAALLGAIDGFDAAFFEISPREAVSLDPQQRLLLEVAWEALEDAGERPDRLMKSRTGVFVGISSADYRAEVVARDIAELEAYDLTGNLFSTAAGRIAYVLGLQGPCMAIDTACSSSLVAVHEACQSLRRGESDRALAGGVNLILDPTNTALLARMQALSPEGRCKTFDASANGFVRGEGCGLVVLKRLSDAERDGDRIWALIRGSAINQDGRSTGLTAPNALAQQDLVRQALASAGAAPEDIGYVEAHGTGTSLGDPIELEALREVLGGPRHDGSRCVLGSVKTNIGHLEAAAGVAGLIKAALALTHEVIPGNLHFRRLNPRVSLDGTPLVIAAEEIPWPRGEKPRRAGISSFGLSGTNAHVVLEEAPRSARPAAPLPGRAAHLLPLSARSAAGLREQARRFAEVLEGSAAPPLAGVAYTAGARRSHHAYRLAVAGRSASELAERLRAWLAQEARPAAAPASAGEACRVVFVFPGQGGQWIGMGRQLLAEEPAFREAIEACDRAMRPHADFSLGEVLRGEGKDAALDRVDVIQPAVFAMQVALAAVFRAWGVTPDAVVGHSMGEVAAAHVAGALGLDDAARIICVRSRLVTRASGQGGMAVVELPAEEARAALRGVEGRLAVGAINGPRSTVLSGERAALEVVLERLERAGVFCRWVKVDYASHSPQMDALRPELLRLLAGVRAERERVPLYSTVTGRRNDGPLDAAYWERNLREPVQFWAAIERLAAEGHHTFLEINPHPVLLPAIEEGLRGRSEAFAAVPSLRRDEGGPERLLGALGALYAAGYAVDFARLYPEGGRVVSLPAYAWQRERFWIEGPARRPRRHGRRGRGEGEHPLLGQRVALSMHPGAHVWQLDLSVAEASWIAEHRIQGRVVLPGAAWVDIALAAARQVLGEGDHRLRKLGWFQPLFLEAEGARTVQLWMQQAGSPDSFDLHVFALDTEVSPPAWTMIAAGALERAPGDAAAEAAPPEPLETVAARCPESLDGPAFVELLLARGLDFGPRFQAIQRIGRGDSEAYALLRLPAQLSGVAEEHVIHPAFLDACFQVLGAFLPEGITYVGKSIDALRLHGPVPAELTVRAARREGGGERAGEVAGDLVVCDADGRLVAEIEGLRVSPLRGAGFRAARAEIGAWLYEVGWEPRPLPPEAPRPAGAAGTWLILSDRGGVGSRLRALLEQRGDDCVLVRPGEAFRRAGAGQYEVDPGSAEDARRLLDEALGGRPCRGVVHLFSLDAAATDALTLPALEEAQRLGVVGALHLVQAIVRAGFRDPPRLWLVTRRARAVGHAPRPVNAAQAPLWGLGHVAALEHPEIGCTRVDLGGAADADAEALLRELSAEDAEDQVAWREGERFVARLAPAADAAERAGAADLPEAAPQLREGGTYLVTGGLGGLGREIAGWLIAQGAQHLALLGRSAPSAEAERALAALRRAGAQVEVFCADVADPDELARALAKVDEIMPPLRGVIHAAGLLDDGVLLNLTGERFARVMAPKVLGAWNLHVLTRTRARPIELFVLFSSAASLLGSAGQGNYAAANAFLDALAHARRAEGLPALSVAWGAWAGVGLAAAQKNRGERLEARGLRGMPPAKALAALGVLLGQPRAHIAVMSLDLRQWLEFYLTAAESPFFARLAREQEAGRRAAAEQRSQIRGDLEVAPAPERRALMERHLREQIGGVLRLDPARLEPSTPLGSLGLDSLMSMEIRNRLEATLGLRLSATLVWTYPTVASLAPYLAEQMGVPLDDRERHREAPAPAPPPASAVVGRGIDELSEEEVERLFAQKVMQGR
ncbi:type I polyketide synthase [Sorangium sp. So ce1078]|uniref:type I polyketide synthase n=1 Tax=Sorangium sp. So ce1078 TaxID=3133329 RepID=UPI003F5DF0D1